MHFECEEWFIYGAPGEIGAGLKPLPAPAPLCGLSSNQVRFKVPITPYKNTPALGVFLYGAPGEIRTHDLCLRRATLYPAELRAQRLIFYQKREKNAKGNFWLFSSAKELYRLSPMITTPSTPTRFLFALCGLTLSLAGCGFRPMYGTYAQPVTNETMNGITVENMAIDTIPDHEGQTLRNNLIDRLYKSGYPSSPTTTLTISKLGETKTELDLTRSSEATRAQLRIKSVMTLTDIASGQTLLTRPLQTVSSYNILGSEFATRVAEKNARENAIHDIARQIELNLALYLNEHKAAP